MSTGELHSFTIITSKANALVAPVHDRMPLVLPREAWSAWLDPANRGSARAARGARVGDWRLDQVSTHVNKADHDDPQCIVPITAP